MIMARIRSSNAQRSRGSSASQFSRSLSVDVAQRGERPDRGRRTYTTQSDRYSTVRGQQ